MGRTAEPPVGAQVAPVVSDRVLTVPNIITLSRLACLPLFLWLLFGRDNRAAAAVLLGALGATDFADGWVARRLDQHSTVGKVLDPTTDRLLFLVAVPAILVDGAVPTWFAVAVLAREGAVALMALALAALGARRIDVTFVGKAGTFALMCTFPLFLLGESTFGGHDVSHVLAWVIGLPGLAISYYAAVRYLPLAQRALRAGRVELT